MGSDGLASGLLNTPKVPARGGNCQVSLGRVEEKSTALFVDRLIKVYADGTHALDALELRLPAGSFFGLLGPNGAGKTTLIGSVAG